MNRRTYLTGVSATLSVLAGCSFTATEPASKDRKLRLVLPGVTKIDSGWRLTIDLATQAFQGVHVFHDVQLFAYSNERTLVGTKRVGTVAGQIEVDIYCTVFPHLIMAQAEESVCDTHIKSNVLEYIGRDEDGEHMWNQRYRECGENLPHVESNKSEENS